MQDAENIINSASAELFTFKSLISYQDLHASIVTFALTLVSLAGTVSLSAASVTSGFASATFLFLAAGMIKNVLEGADLDRRRNYSLKDGYSVLF